MMPMTVRAMPLTWTCRPSTPAFPLYRRLQSRSPRIATGSAPSRSSALVKVRPAAGRRPNTFGSSSAICVLHDYQPLRILIRKTHGQYGVHDAEHGDVGADANRQRQHRKKREDGSPATGADRVAEIADEGFERLDTPDV